jgi:hypothetical protein
MDYRSGHQCRWRQRLGKLVYGDGSMNRNAKALILTTTLMLWISGAYGQNPTQTAPAKGGACDVPREYVTLINDGKYASVGNLFADDAVYMGPDGKTRHGAKNIGAFYSVFLPKLKLQLRASRFFEQGNECMMELETKNNQTGGYDSTAVDHFTIDSAGRISRFIVYLRPGAQATRELRNALSQTH